MPHATVKRSVLAIVLSVPEGAGKDDQAAHSHVLRFV